MWRVVWFFAGTVRLRIHAAAPEACLQRLAARRIAFRFVQKPDEFCVEILVLQKDAARAEAALRAGGAECVRTARLGFGRVFGGLWRRPVLLILLVLAIAAAVIVPKFVFFYEVSGNETVPDAQILRELEALGVRFGTYGPSIDPQELKNQMLLRIGKLQWLTVQQSGMCARVVVRERLEKEPVLDRRTPANVVAARAGVITSISAEAGSSVCQVGQAVAAGELLISAFTDFGYKTQATAARGEVYARTLHRLQCVLPQSRLQKMESRTTWRAISLRIGHRRVHLFGRTQADGICEKQTDTRYLQLPGGFSLPIGIEITTICEYDTREEFLQEQQVQQQLAEQAEAAVRREMVAGTITGSTCRLTRQDGAFCLDAALQCEEMIARIRPANVKDAIQ